MNELKIFKKGIKNNPALIFIHGFPFDHNLWQNQVDFLKDDFFCLSYDIRGLGESPAVDGQFTMEMFADDLFEIIKNENINKPIICGLSMGGYIALRAVEKNQESFGGLILCDTKSGSDDNEGKLKRALGIKKINESGVQSFVNEFISNCFVEESHSKDFYKETLNRSLQYSPSGVKGSLLAMAGRTDTSHFLPRINIPVLLICGEKDKLTPPHLMEEMSKLIPDSEFHIIPGAGHITPLEKTKEFNKIMKDFLVRKVVKSDE
jgi:pimeloyl-ACP methyl ester carboxylesterase